MRQFVHRALSAAPTQEENKLIMVEVEPACLSLSTCKEKQKLMRVFGNGKCLKSWVQKRVHGQGKMASTLCKRTLRTLLIPSKVSSWNRVVTWTVGVTTCKFQFAWRVKHTRVVLVMFMFLAHTPDLPGSIVLLISRLASGVDQILMTCGKSTDSKSGETTCLLSIGCKRTSPSEEQSRRGPLVVVRRSIRVVGDTVFCCH